MVIYKVTNMINGKMYIGQTRGSFEARMRRHQLDAEQGIGFYFQCAIRHYGWENFKAESIAETDDPDELDRLEEYYIKLYNTTETGYNLALGGKNNTMDSPKIKLHHDEVMRSPEVRSKISQSMKDHINKPGNKQKYVNNLRNGFDRYKKSEKFKEDCKNKHLSESHFKALNECKYKPVYCINESGDIIGDFPSVKSAAQWWYNNGYSEVKSFYHLYDYIKKSSKEDIFIRGLKWIYRV